MLYDMQKDKIEVMILRSRSRYEDLTVSWKLILKVLDYFNLETQQNRGWVYFKKGLKHVFYKRGLGSDSFYSLRRGCRQRRSNLSISIYLIRRNSRE